MLKLYICNIKLREFVNFAVEGRKYARCSSYLRRASNDYNQFF